VVSDGTGLAAAVELVETKRYAEAAPALRSLLGSDERLEDYHLYFLGVAEARSGDSHGLGHLGLVRTQQPQSIWAPAAALEIGRIYRQRGQWAEAEAFVIAAEEAPEASTRAEAQYERAQILEGQGRDLEAAEVIAQLRRSQPGAAVVPQARALLRRLRAANPALALQGSQWRDEAEQLLEERDYADAEKAARTADPYGDDLEARLLLAEALKGQGNVSAAITVLGVVVERFPDDPRSAKALARMAQLLWNQNEDVAAEAAYLQFLKRYPDDRATPDALYALGRIQQSARRPAEAIVTFERLTSHYPEAKMAWEARWRIGWIQYDARRYDEAATTFAALARSSREPEQVAAARYWQARAMAQSGSTDEVYRRILQEAPLSYYSWRAEERLGEEHNAGTVSRPPSPLPLPPPPATLNPYHLQRYQALRELGMNGFARREAAALERESSDAPAREFLFYAYANADDYPAARRLGREVEIAGGARERVLYPLAFWPEVSSASETNRVDPLLVASLIRQESLFDPDARSPADARGLMQLTPATARKEAESLGWKDDPTNRLEDPSVNVSLGVRHLRSLLDAYDDDVIKALAAYNGGTSAVGRWQSQFAELEGDEFVESITYRETRDYVKRVLGNRRAYRILYAE
jgi:soluble lytic murein transglycosylase